MAGGTQVTVFNADLRSRTEGKIEDVTRRTLKEATVPAVGAVLEAVAVALEGVKGTGLIGGGGTAIPAKTRVVGGEPLTAGEATAIGIGCSKDVLEGNAGVAGEAAMTGSS